ncbi:hypothetical protein [Candidatus Rhabdochlamydia porcellionis]|jgi:hypothetical protein|uniref:Ankyrin repeat protein n=1 Tax=Candidatus Rhabdochlamydia porcellionis TaxID=225148 RepID=A0ABX8Z0A3_9BACT|nr:hypothetical protein [Candidatus Rhabdochlamydia porcellionis]QZA59089.1 hypothetical protein RHAB15C_0000973 [Candidatus Rhabdochlamydia porcellionis]
MSINLVSNSYIDPNLVSILDKDRFYLFEKICSYLKPLDMQAFLSTYKSPRLICKNLKENNPITYKALMTRIFSNSFTNKSVEELSSDIIHFCKEGKSSQLKELFQSLKICDKFHEISIKTLNKAFSWTCFYTHAKIVKIFIKSSRFHEISEENLGNALDHASINGHPGIVEVIINSTRACEISINDLEKALENAAGNGGNTVIHLKSLKYLINSPSYQKISTNGLGQALIRACKNQRHDAVQELGKSTRFNEISREHLKEIYHLASYNKNLRNFLKNLVELYKTKT